MEKRKISLKNYVIAFVIVLLVVLGSLYACSWYKTIKEYNLNKSVIADTVNKIELETLESYITDNSNFIMYLASSNDEDVKSFERKFKRYIKNNSLNNEIIYLDIKDYDSEQILNTLLNYKSENLKNLKNIPFPNLLIFENGKVEDILYLRKTSINRKDAIEFIEKGNLS